MNDGSNDNRPPNSNTPLPTSLILGTAGHIDHGKTALIQALTGTNTDRLPEEKKRGITIEPGFTQLILPPFKLGIVDVPGHERFVRNMLSGATGMDVVMLVVAADDSVKPQTVEHLDILRYLDVRIGIIAITKCDLVDYELLELVEEEVREACLGTFFENAPCIHTSSETGEGIEELKSALCQQCQSIGNATLPNPIDAPFRMAIDRCFSVEGHGTIVTGSVTSGQLHVDEHVMLQPGEHEVRVRSLQNHDNSGSRVIRGERAAINLAGIHPDEIQKGMELATPGFLDPHQLVTVHITVTPNSRFPLKNHMPVRLHLGTANHPASLKLLEQDELLPGEQGVAQIISDAPVVCGWNQPFVLRMESPAVTIAGGRILDPCAQKIGFQDQQQLGFVRGLISSNDDQTRIESAIGVRTFEKPTHTDLTRMTGIEKPENHIRKLIRDGKVLEVELSNSTSQLIHLQTLNSAKSQGDRTLNKLHDENPLSVNFNIAPVRERLRVLAVDSVLNQIFSLLQKQGLLQVSMGRVGLKSRGPKLTKNEARLLEHLQTTLQQTGLQAPLLKELQQQAGKQAEAVSQLLKIAESGGAITKISEELYLSVKTVENVENKLKALMTGETGKTMAEIRDALGTTRKYAVPLCEYLDRTGFTVRKDDLRFLG
ncbi:MAG: selenocysteine-specific translation elongation factor [Pirellulales bacterium]|nr:selenocysteine-specific translation elongation factor [Pirellulales bacterium]